MNASTKTSKTPIRTGYWANVDLDEPDFTFLQGIMLTSELTMPIHLDDYLHGVCSVAALALHDIFGYQILSLYDVSEARGSGIESKYSGSFPIIHDFCFDPKHDIYIDVRGICSDFDEFISEFDDFIEDPQNARDWTTKIGSAKKYRAANEDAMGKETFNYYYTAVAAWVKSHKEMYMVANANGGKHD